MEYLRTAGNFPALSASAVTIGKFDGLHRGHRKLIEYVQEQKEKHLTTVLLSLGIPSQTIFSCEERRRLAENLGMDLLIECPLNEEIRLMEPDDFIENILVKRLHTKILTVGDDFRFGHDRKGNVQMLCSAGKRYGFHVEVIPALMDGLEKISSSRIRRELASGNMEECARLLGQRFFVEGKIVHGKGLGHKMLLPTANMIPGQEKLMPPNGVYMTVSIFGKKSWAGITNVGVNPTVKDGFLAVETYLFDCEEDLYDQECRVEFYHYRRPEKKFGSLDELKTQLLTDAEAGRAYFHEVLPELFKLRDRH